MDRETAALLGLPYEEEGVEAPLSGLGYRDLLRKRLQKDIEESETEESQSFQTVLNNIELAKQRLLAQPSRQETLQQIASKLTQPRERTDPRFFERRNLYTFLRDIGEYGSEREAAQKKAQEQAAKLEDLAAKYKFERAQERGSKARQLMAQYLSKEEAEKKDELPSEVRQVEYYQNIVANPNQFASDRVQFAKDWLAKNVRVPEDGKDKTGLSPAEIRSIGMEVRSQTDPAREKVGFANDALGKLKLAMEGNPQAEVQVDRALATLAGDKQLSLAEVQSITGAGSFAQRVTNAISKFFTGGAGELTNEQKKELLEFYEDYYGNAFNNARERVKRIYSGTGYEALPEDIFGSRYVTIREKREKQEREAASAKPEGESISTSTGKTGRKVD
jgi:hypothetical protein